MLEPLEPLEFTRTRLPATRAVDTSRLILRVSVMAGALMHLLAIEQLEVEEEEERRILRLLRNRKDPFTLDDRKFIRLYRLNKPLVRELIASLEGTMRAPLRTTGLSIETKVFAALRFYAGGPYQGYVGQDEYTAMDQSTVSRCLEEVTNAINDNLLDRWVTFNLNPQNIASLRQRFFDKYGFPGVIGAIDCTHIAIVAPPVDHPVYRERDYFNHKRFHSVNVQLICDADMRILNVNARYPGSTHDAFIYANSSVRTALSEMHANRYSTSWLIGDSGYPLEPWLLTPFPGIPAPNSPEERYNASLCRARCVIERCNGLLKSRFRCLCKHRTLHYMPEKASRIINACVVLHNMCVAMDDPELMEILHPAEDEEIEGNPERAGNELRAGRLVRERVARQYFTE